MELFIAFATDDGDNFNDDHFGMARLFHIYTFSRGREEFIETRKNARYQEDETLRHGDPEKAQAVSSVLKDIDVIVGRKMGPNIVRLLKKYVCIVIKTTSINDAIVQIHKNMKKIMEQKGKGEDRKHIVLRP
ncbi:MAG TPA: NifB/NifX family molybdenum-iron cluster-binding protein [Deltaproteobacteria bacterium]|nr:NifB/NifX family molybdenum-iron cluster-binding protein [Deltaproteobacteria bacterium]